jgi:lipopolysaccharide transport system ATP-binding protein
MGLSVIEVEGLSKKYRLGVVGATTLRDEFRRWHTRGKKWRGAEPDEFWALRDVSFSVQSGEVVGIIGRNGAGKSTLLKILSRITEPTSGRAVLRGRVASLLEVGTGFHPDLTGRENVYLNGAILGMKQPEIAARFDEIVAFAEIEKFIDTPVKHYSSGMRVRLAFAVAAHLEPEILIVDEVLAVGDAQFQKKCANKIGHVATLGRTILFVSHDMRKAASLCTRGVLLNQGRVELLGPIADVAAKYFEDNAAGDDGVVDLTSRRDRSGNGDARVEALAFYNAERPTNTFAFGDVPTVKIGVHLYRPSGPCRIALIITTDDHTPLYEAWNVDDSCDWPGKMGTFDFTVSIPELRLYPGNYAVDLWIENARGARVDYVTDAARFHIIHAPNLSLARPLDRANGVIFSPSRWSCVPGDS